jgi:hypothetical protein
MQDSPEQGNNGVLGNQKRSLPDLVLGNQVYSRHLGFPSVSPVGAGIAGRLAWFGAEERLPLARSVLQRWSASGGGRQSLPSLQWLSSFTSGRKTIAASPMPRRVTKISSLSEASVDTAVAGEIPSSLPSDPTSSAVRALSDRTTNQNETTSAKPSASTRQASMNEVRTVAKRAEVTGASVADSGTDTASPASFVRVPTTSTDAMQSSNESAGTPVFRSTYEKSGSAAKVRSTISESVQRRGSGVSTHGVGEPHGKTGTSTPSMPLSRGVHFPIETASGKASSGKLTKEAARKEAKEKELTHVDPAGQSGEPMVKMDADPRPGTEGRASILRVAEPAPAGTTFVGPPIFRRSVGRQARTALPANGSRLPEKMPDSGMLAAPDTRVFHTVNRKEESKELHREDRQSASRAAMGAHTPSVELSQKLPKLGAEGTVIEGTSGGGKSGPELKPPSIGDSNSALRLRAGEPYEAVFPEPAAAARPMPVYKASSSNAVRTSAINKLAGSDAAGHFHSNAPEGRIDAGATHFSTVSEVPPAVTGGEVGAFVQPTHTVTRSPRNQREAGKDSSVQIPSIIHAQLSSRPENSQSAAVGNKASSAAIQVQSPPRSASMQPTIARATDALLVATSSEGRLTSASPRASKSQNPESAVTPVFLDSGSSPGQRLHDSTTTDQVKPRTNSGHSEVEVQSVGSNPTVALFPLEARSSQAVARAVHPDQPASDSPGLTHLASATSTTPLAEMSPTQTEKPERPAENSNTAFASPVSRHVEGESLKVEGGNTAKEFGAAGDGTIHRNTAKVAQLSWTQPRAAITLGHGPLAARRTETSMLRQSALPMGLPRLSTFSAVSGSHRLDSLSVSENVHRSSATLLNPVTSSARSSTLTHRVVPAIDRLQRVPENYPAGISSGMNATGSYPLVARAAGSAAGVPVTNTPVTPSLPAVTNQSSGTFQGLKRSEITQLANRVYDLLVQRLASERQRRGQ